MDWTILDEIPRKQARRPSRSLVALEVRPVRILIFLLSIGLGLSITSSLRAEGHSSPKIEINARFREPSEIFSPQSMVALDVQTTFPETQAGSEGVFPRPMTLQISVYKDSEPIVEAETGTLVSALRRGSDQKKESLFEQELSVSVERNSVFPVVFLAPAGEGVYRTDITLVQKTESSSGTFWNLSAASLQRQATRVVSKTSNRFVVLAPEPGPAAAAVSFTESEKELVETIDFSSQEANTSSQGKRWSPIAPLPKVAHLATPKIPEIPRFTGFRDRPGTTVKNATATSSDPGEPNDAPAPPDPTGVFEVFSSQWSTGKNTLFGSGHFVPLRSGTPQPEGEPEYGSDPSPVHEASLSDFCVLKASDSKQGETWQAFPMTLRDLDAAHLLEIDYPEGIPQTLGIEICDQFSGNKTTIERSLRSELCVIEELVTGTPPGRPATFRALFWSRTKNPMLLLVNKSPDRDALFGGIRLYRFNGGEAVSPEQSAGHVEPVGKKPGRLIAGYVHQPRFFQHLVRPGAEKETPDASVPSDWNLLVEGTERFMKTVRAAGYDGMMLNVASARGCLYPSAHRTSPFSQDRPESGTENAKDVLELLFRHFNRESRTLIPAVDFNMPLRPVEAILKQHPEWESEIFVIDSEGHPLPLPSRGDVSGKRYNLLHPIVQDAILAMLRELIERSAPHAAFGGIAIQLTPDGYAQLTDPMLGFDDLTLARFQQETGIRLPSGVVSSLDNLSPQRFAARAYHFRTQTADAELWIRWRTEKVRDFYARVAELLRQFRPDSRLYLAGGTMLDNRDIRQFCMPTLTYRSALPYALRMLGFDLNLLSETPGITFLRPNRISPCETDPDVAGYADFNSEDLNALFAKFDPHVGVLFFHGSGDGSEAIHAGDRARRRFVKQLAIADVSLFFDGGYTLPCGEEEALADFLAAFRQLPPGAFQTYEQKSEGQPAPTGKPESGEHCLQPLIVRYCETPNGLVLCLLNEAPFGIQAELTFSAQPEAALIELSGRRPLEPSVVQMPLRTQSIRLKPYDLLALRIEDPKASLQKVRVHRPGAICGENGTLHAAAERLGRLLDEARRGGVPWNELENPGCECPEPPSDNLWGWNRYGDDSFLARFDTDRKYVGRSSLCLALQRVSEKAHDPSPLTPGIVYSNPFDAPPTGRLFTSIVVGVFGEPETIPLNVVLSAKYRDGSSPRAETPRKEPFFFRTFSVEPALLPNLSQPAPAGGMRWQRIVVPFDRLPTDQLEELRLGLEMSGQGTVWVDDIKLYQVAFTKEETNRLYRLVMAADFRRTKDRVSDLLAILEGYWARYLFQHVPDPPSPIQIAPGPVKETPGKAYADQAAPVQKSTAPAETPKKETPGFLDRVKGWFGR